jgi:hypothetical protein
LPFRPAAPALERVIWARLATAAIRSHTDVRLPGYSSDDGVVSEIQPSDPGASERLSDALTQVVNGDLRAMPTIAGADHDDLSKAARSIPQGLVVTRAAAVTVLQGFDQGTITPDEAQAWASFVRWGFVLGGRGPIAPIDIDYEEACEEAIVEAIGRLDEIGDLVDGDVSPAEVLLLLQLLGVP